MLSKSGWSGAKTNDHGASLVAGTTVHVDSITFKFVLFNISITTYMLQKPQGNY